MKQILLLTLFLLPWMIFASGEKKELILADEGKSLYRIVLPKRTDRNGVEKYLRYTAERLRDMIRESSGAEIPVIRENEMPPGAPGIWIGNTEKLRRSGVDVSGWSGVECLIRISGDHVFLAGNDRHRDGAHWADLPENHILGSVRAAVLFMEKFLGAEFLIPGKNGTNVPVRKKITLPSDFSQRYPARFSMAAGRTNELLYDYANNNFGFGQVFHYRGHSYYAAVPRKKYAETHPEYFILSGGRRDSSSGHLCISNPDVQKLIYEEALRRLDAGADIVQVAQTDGYKQCECPSCAAYGNVSDPGEKLWILHLSFAEKLKKDRPGKKLQLLAYAPAWDPPRTFKEFPGNVIIELCRYTPENFGKWRDYKGICGFAVYLYNWGEYPMPGLLPKREADFLAKQAKLFSEQRVSGIYRCGHGELFGLEGPGYYVHARMMEHPEWNAQTLRKHYIERTFLESAAPMIGFYNLLDARLRAFSALEGAYGSDSLLPRDPRVLICFLFSPENLSLLKMKLASAKRLAHDPKVKARLFLVERELEYADSLARTLHFYNAYRILPDEPSFERLGNAVTAHKKLVDSFYDASGKCKKLAGWPEIRFLGEMSRSMLMTNGRLSAEIGAPLNWNIPLLRKKKVLPGASVRRMKFIRCGKTPPFDFSNPEWEKAQWQELQHIQLGALKEQTRFKVLYDAHNLYFAFESDLPAVRKHKAMGHDGAPWLQDSMEILLDPLGSREISYHFICNPIENSYYEDAFGLITDPLHPKYNKEDPSWNGKWTYQTRRSGDRWYLLVTIPFASFGMSTPAYGSVWTMNVARQSYHSPGMKWAGEIGLWSPNLENMSISSNLAAFGEIVFE